MESHTSPDDSDATLRRPMNAFLLFCKRHRSIVKRGHPWLDNRSCTKMLADMWAVLDWDEKSKYLQLARECKMAFMKAHPDYKWCGSNKHTVKGGSSTMRTRTKSPSKHLQKPSCGVRASDDPSQHDTPLSSSRISPGKLADPCDMGGLSLLLLAGEQTMSKATSTSPQAIESPLSPKSRLFEFAEMCSDQLDLRCKSEITTTGEPVRDCHADYNSNCILSIKTSVMQKVGAYNEPENQRCCSVADIKKDHCERFSIDAFKDIHREPDLVASCEKRKLASGKTSSMEHTKDGEAELSLCGVEDEAFSNPCPPLDKDLNEPGSALQCSADENHSEDTLDLPSSSDGGDWIDEQSTRRTSSRSCKGRLYREFVMEGMLESLQRPERPFNCKKSWKQLDGSSLSDGDDVIFEPSPDKPRRASRRRTRKRTVSGCGSLPSSMDFDYGEIDVEARLASLPQYSPDQFKPKGKCHRLKKSTCLYKNATFVKKDGKTVGRHLSKDQSLGTSGAERPPVAGSRKRKAPKSSILHLTLSSSKASSPACLSVSPNNSISAQPFIVDGHPRSTDKGTSSQPSTSNNDQTSECQTSDSELSLQETVNVSAVETKAFAGSLMTDSQLPSTSSHVITAASTVHRPVLTVS